MGIAKGGHVVQAENLVLLLGAGFSRAISSEMPLTNELGDAVVERLGLTDSDGSLPALRSASFERWLSHLADEQPFLSKQQNVENQALFLRISEAVAEVLGEQQHKTMLLGAPEWLKRLVIAAHWSRATVITFNYDTLVEWATTVASMEDGQISRPFPWSSLTDGLPAPPPGGPLYPQGDVESTFRLLKLHGSLNWYWTPGDLVGTSVARRDLPIRDGIPRQYDDESRRRRLPGRVPLVVPPSAAKSGFYGNPFMRELWNQAHQALRTANAVTLIGYSLPSEDLTVAHLLASGLAGGGASVSVVDPNPEPAAGRLVRLGIPESRVSRIGVEHGDPVACFVDEWIERLTRNAYNELAAIPEALLDDPMLVVWDKAGAAAVVEIEVLGTEVLCVVERHGMYSEAGRVRTAEDVATLPALRDLLNAGVQGAFVVTSDGGRQAVLGSGRLTLDHGYGRGRWHTLFTDGEAPSGP